MKCLTEGAFLSSQPKLNKDSSKAFFLGCDEQFLEHSSSYDLKVIDLATNEVRTVIDKTSVKEDEFLGIYGYHLEIGQGFGWVHDMIVGRTYYKG